ncbi:hypothetical protein D3C71_1611750 [compost metagenome]
MTPTRLSTLPSGVLPLTRSNCEPTENTAIGGARVATACARIVGRRVFWPKNGTTERVATTLTALSGLAASTVMLK